MSGLKAEKQATAGVSNPAAFEFVTTLAGELSSGRVDLPSYPEVAARLQQALSDPEIATDRVARMIGSDAGLAARVLTMANSSLLRRSSAPVTDLKVAVTRIGQEHIRSATLAYASAQLRRAAALQPVRKELETCWHQGVRLAALAHAIARETHRARADEALLAGLMHNVGKVYILARSAQNPNLHWSEQERGEILRDWHCSIGQAVIENWKLPEQIALAVGGQNDVERAHIGPPDLQDLLVIALQLAEQMEAAKADDSQMLSMAAAVKLGLDDSALVRIVLDSQADIEMLQAALG